MLALVTHLIENIYRSGLTLVSSNNLITIKIEKKLLKKPQENKMKRGTNSDHDMEKKIICNFSLFK